MLIWFLCGLLDNPSNRDIYNPDGPHCARCRRRIFFDGYRWSHRYQPTGLGWA